MYIRSGFRIYGKYTVFEIKPYIRYIVYTNTDPNGIPTLEPTARVVVVIMGLGRWKGVMRPSADRRLLRSSQVPVVKYRGYATAWRSSDPCLLHANSSPHPSLPDDLLRS